MIKTDIVHMLVRNLKNMQVLQKTVCQLFMGNTEVVLGTISYWTHIAVGDVFQIRQYKRFSFPSLLHVFMVCL